MIHAKSGAMLLLLAVFVATACALPLQGRDGLGGGSGEGGAHDTSAPTVLSTEPVDTATDWAVTSPIHAVFSEAMDPATLTGATFTLARGGTPVEGTVSYQAGKTTFAPDLPLMIGTLYLATLTIGVTDLAHNPLAEQRRWSFTTSAVLDTTPPTVLSTIPANNASKVDVSSPISATFSEAMDPLTVTDATFTVTNKGAPVAGNVAVVGAIATFTPESPLVLDGTFVAKVSTAMKDLSGNALASPFSWKLSTPERPVVIATSPANGVMGVAINRRLDAAFSVAMAPASITASMFLVKEGATPVPGAVTYLGTTATFTPKSNYSINTTLTATITTGAKDTSGTTLGQDHVWTFQTGTKATQAPVALGLASPYGVLADSMVVNTASLGTLVTGDLGISPGTVLMGFPPGLIVGGKYIGPASDAAQVDLLAAYNDASGRLSAAPLAADLTSLKLTPGLYHHASAVTVSTGNCTLDAEGDADAVFILQVVAAFHMAADTKILLTGGAKAANVYWAVGAAVTLGANATFVGNMLAATDITLGNMTKVDGRLLSHGGAVTLDMNPITVPVL